VPIPAATSSMASTSSLGEGGLPKHGAGSRSRRAGRMASCPTRWRMRPPVLPAGACDLLLLTGVLTTSRRSSDPSSPLLLQDGVRRGLPQTAPAADDGVSPGSLRHIKARVRGKQSSWGQLPSSPAARPPPPGGPEAARRERTMVVRFLLAYVQGREMEREIIERVRNHT
jgi:hypothetical protein